MRFFFAVMPITLLVAATVLESTLIREGLQMQALTGTKLDLWQSETQTDCYLIHSGIGMVNMAYALGQVQAQYEVGLAINFGIAGTFDRTVALGSVVEVVADCFAELGADSPTGPLWLEQMGFPLFAVEGQAFYNELYNPSPSDSVYPKMNAITVNRVGGTSEGITQRLAEWPRDLETMEGAAFFMAFLRSRTPFYAFRGISNYVEPRNRDNWQIGPALRNVQQAVLALLPDFE
ncbi:MAG: futalosine hydrolase [Bacteroidota bacterium]